ncbi:hypothetical protein B0T13DRAFT_236278 [Neurospora crassa]|nr:hypothetical protein B0T13DRAFT_236278 [Neurospora crassa]
MTSGCSHSGIARRGLGYSKLGGRSGENPCDIRLLRLNWTLVSSGQLVPTRDIVARQSTTSGGQLQPDSAEPTRSPRNGMEAQPCSAAIPANV